MTFGPRRADGFDEAARQLGEYLAGQRREFDLALGLRGDEFRHERQAPGGQVPPQP
jgi:hypothetical protein